MKFNGINPADIHPVISVSKEIYPSMPAREIATVETRDGALVANVSVGQDEAIIRINIAGRTYDEAMAARLALAEWAGSSRNQTAELEPTHAPGKAYSAILRRITEIENRFATVDVVFLIPRPYLHSTTVRQVSGTGAAMTYTIGGSAKAQPAFELVLSAAAEGLIMLADNRMMLAMSGMLNANDAVVYNPHTGALTINGVHAEERLLYADIDFNITFYPGAHTLQVSAPGTMTARWRDEWL